MIINNVCFDSSLFNAEDLYVFSIGYEHRSYSLYDKVVSQLPTITPIVFVFNDYEKYPHTINKVNEIKKRTEEIHFENYEDYQKVQQVIKEIIIKYTSKRDRVTIHIDYSAMPRSWYCKLPMMLKNIIRETDTVYFWYSEGRYPSTYEEYPSAGIESFSLFSGKPSLRIDNNRIHVLGVGYDVIRSQAILSITDPDYFVACYAYNPNREGFLNSLESVNSPIISRAAMTIALHVDDFEFMLSKLCETANELLPFGDVIIIPDGPKPLVFAFSLVPDMLNKNGLTCLHISRNHEHFEAIDVESTGNIYGFTMRVSS